MTTSTLRKRCACKASSSGPRVVTRTEWCPRRMGYFAVVQFVAMACDECGTPWTEPTAKPRRRIGF